MDELSGECTRGAERDAVACKTSLISRRHGCASLATVEPWAGCPRGRLAGVVADLARRHEQTDRASVRISVTARSLAFMPPFVRLIGRTDLSPLSEAPEAGVFRPASG